MENYLKYKRFEIRESITDEKINELLLKFNSTQGIDKISCVRQSIYVIYNPYEISEKEIVNGLSTFGLSVKMDKKKSIKNRLKKMAEENKEDFGSKRLGCCDLNN
ncbi:MAG: hypothetical protein L3J11_04920 [Draconibacterium sp.]|nr:hypothetical protein [Draconibacterium sp.]